MRNFLASLILLQSAAIVAAPAALPDLLDMPAVQNARSLHELVLDITTAGERLVAVGAYGVILYSDDAGVSWQQARVPVQSTLTSVYFPTPEKGWAVGHDAIILHSSDAGESWQRQLDGRQTGDMLVESTQAWMEELEVHTANSDAYDDELVMAQDAAMMAYDEALREQQIGPNRPLMDVLFLDEKRGFAIGAFNYFFVTDDGGRNWRDGAPILPNPEMLHLYSITQQRDGSLLVVGEFGLVLRSQDLGLTWQTLELNYGGTLFQVSSAGERTWIAGLRGNVFYTDDSGENWQRVALEHQNSWLGAMALKGKKAVFVGLSGAMITIEGEEGGSIEFYQVSPGHLAAVHMSEYGRAVIAGDRGLARVNPDGTPASISYQEIAN